MNLENYITEKIPLLIRMSYRTLSVMNKFRDNSLKFIIFSHGEIVSRTYSPRQNEMIIHTGHLGKTVCTSKDATTVSLFSPSKIYSTFAYLSGNNNFSMSSQDEVVLRNLFVYTPGEYATDRIHSFKPHEYQRVDSPWGIFTIDTGLQRFTTPLGKEIDQLMMRPTGAYTSEIVNKIHEEFSNSNVMLIFVSCAVLNQPMLNPKAYFAATEETKYLTQPSMTGGPKFVVNPSAVKQQKAFMAQSSKQFSYPSLKNSRGEPAEFHEGAFNNNNQESENDTTYVSKDVAQNPLLGSIQRVPPKEQYEIYHYNSKTRRRTTVHSEYNDYNTTSKYSVRSFLNRKNFKNSVQSEQAKGNYYRVAILTRDMFGNPSIEEVTLDEFKTRYNDAQIKTNYAAQENFQDRVFQRGIYAPKQTIAIQENKEKEKSFCERCTNAICSLWCKLKLKGGKKTRKVKKLKKRKTKHRKH